MTFRLSATVGGSPITLTNSGSISISSTGVGLVPVTAPSGTSTYALFAGYREPDSYTASFRGRIRWMEAVGVTGLSAVGTDADNRVQGILTQGGQTIGQYYQGNPKYAFGDTF